MQIRVWTHKNTQYLALACELWGIVCKDLEKIDRVITTPHCVIHVPIFFMITSQALVLLYVYPNIREIIHKNISQSVYM